MDATNKDTQPVQSERRTVLSEYDAKAFLAGYGVPVVSEKKAADIPEAVAAAREIGFPVVLKGLGPELLHKTENQLVHLNLESEASVEAAAKAVYKSAGDRLAAYLIQPQISGKREFVAGLFNDAQYGPVVMFGLGGIFTEVLSDVTFRLAPISQADAAEMITELRASSMLGAVRGEAPVNRDRLIQTLTGLSRLAEENPDIREVDINPLLIDPDGSPVAVDALVIKGGGQSAKQFPPPVDPRHVGGLFYPRSVAFVGASSQIGKWGYNLLTNTISGGFEGDIYLVNPKGGTIAGRPVYPSIEDIPGPVDVGVVTIPAAKVKGLIPQFKEKGIRNMLLIASGFSETGAEGAQQEQELVDAARAAGIHIIGPNTMGISNPHINFYCTGSHVRPKPGATSVVAQSGNMGQQLLAFAELQGIGIRGFCGSGNEAMITIEDYLDAFEVDELTETVMLYIESVKNGRRFFESARRVGRKKPIVLLKGGQTKAGIKAAASHTGALASNNRVFNAVCRQAGIVKVEKPMDLLDLSAAFSSLPLPAGSRVAIMTLGGGWGVVAADLCEAYGLTVPELDPNIIEAVNQILPPYWSRSNPIDLVGENDPSIPITVLEALMKWDGCDAVINLGIMGRRHMVSRLADSVRQADPACPADFLEKINRSHAEFEDQYIAHIVSLMEQHPKPVLGVSMVKDETDRTVYTLEDRKYKGLFFPAPEQAVKSLAKMYEYQRFCQREDRRCQ
ncbi:MAG: acetate--CoA ligase family protein [Desulfobacterales bacterium]|nr:acetate--CoA ligase family protein [Desulfobacterales bacterium]